MSNAIHIILYGQVQGVCLRATAKEIATTLSLVGTVQNLPDDTVELFLVTDAHTAYTFLEKLKQSLGSNFIQKADISPVQLKHPPDRFMILH